MADFVKCKACGYITEKNTIKDVCPACGVPSKMFEPYTQPVSAERRRILDLHTHPVMVHFPQAFALTLFLFSLLTFIAPLTIQNTLDIAMQVLSVLLPFFVVGSIATGLMDGKIRFRKVTTPMLKKKILLSLIFFSISVAMAVLAVSGQHLITFYRIIYTLLALAVSFCGALLGLIGGKLLNARFPG